MFVYVYGNRSAGAMYVEGVTTSVEEAILRRYPDGVEESRIKQFGTMWVIDNGFLICGYEIDAPPNPDDTD